MSAKESLIIREVRKPRGSTSRLIRYYECNCLTQGCETLTYRDVYEFKRWSGYCKKCSDLTKIRNIDRAINTTAIRPYEALFNNLVKQATRRCKELSLSYEEFVELTNQDNCHYCNSEVTWTKVNTAANGSRTNLDRKDNSSGYSKENVVVCCWRCNNGRGNLFSYEEWFGMTKFLRDKKGI
jgi:superfamily II DNA helicase RecQ